MVFITIISFVLFSIVVSIEPVPPERDPTPYEATFDGLGSGTGVVDSFYPNVVQFFGIPYSYPPVNERRFRVPKLMDSWSEKLNLEQYKPLCHQGNNEEEEKDWEPGVSEDCLYLNIFAPKEAIENPNGNYPVQVYFHGGGYQRGTG